MTDNPHDLSDEDIDFIMKRVRTSDNNTVKKLLQQLVEVAVLAHGDELSEDKLRREKERQEREKGDRLIDLLQKFKDHKENCKNIDTYRDDSWLIKGMSNGWSDWS